MAKDKNGETLTSPPEDERLSDREDYRRAEENHGEHEMTTAEREQAAEMTDPVRRRAIRQRWAESVLPELPIENGWHRCWVSTTHPLDTPQRRRRYGYRFLKYEDINKYGWSADVDAVKDGAFSGAVMWRELVAMECSMQDYEDYMREFHFDQPYEQAQGIYQNLDETADRARERGGRVTFDEGMEDMKRRIARPPPRQFEG